jgi:GNAT superfamily N-acetyltransferase
MKFTVRPAAPTELVIILSLLKEAAQKLAHKGVDQWGVWLMPTADKIEWIKEGFDNGEFNIVEDTNGVVAGMFRLSYTDVLYWGENNDVAAYVHSLTVTKEFAGHKLGEFILSYIEQHLKGNNIYTFRLDCNAGNKWLCNYYESQGFVKVGEKQMPHALNNLYQKQLV